MDVPLEHIARLLHRDPGQRGLAAHITADDLRAAAKTLGKATRVIIVTGFCIRAAGIGETDGPPGALLLADALRQAGAAVVLASDRYSLPLLEAGAGVLGHAFPTVALDLPQVETDRCIQELLADFRPSHVIAIERPGDAADGHRYSMRGEALDDLIASTDALLVRLPGHDFVTLAIGDGGNELGLGGLREAFMHKVTHGERIFSVTAADHVISAGISNWGAQAIVAALSLHHGRALMHPPATERAVIAAMVAAGAVDGCTRRQALSVDGVAIDDYLQTVAELHAAMQAGLHGASGRLKA